MINQFRGKYYFLSNFYPCKVRYRDDWYPSSEHAFQAAKAPVRSVRISFQDSDMSAAGAKHLGKNMPLITGWNNIRIEVMTEVLDDKFSRNLFLREKLLETGDELLVEGNTWGDHFWGVDGDKGQNHLGEILMKLREKYKGDIKC